MTIKIDYIFVSHYYLSYVIFDIVRKISYGRKIHCVTPSFDGNFILYDELYHNVDGLALYFNDVIVEEY